MPITRSIVSVVLLEVLSGCVLFCGPDRWATRLELEVKCGMPPQQVANLADRQTEKMEVPTAWGTHLIRDGATDVWLNFQEDRLQSIQIGWTYAYGKVLFSQPIKLCASTVGPQP